MLFISAPFPLLSPLLLPLILPLPPPLPPPYLISRLQCVSLQICRRGRGSSAHQMGKNMKMICYEKISLSLFTGASSNYIRYCFLIIKCIDSSQSDNHLPPCDPQHFHTAINTPPPPPPPPPCNLGSLFRKSRRYLAHVLGLKDIIGNVDTDGVKKCFDVLQSFDLAGLNIKILQRR